MKLPWMKTASSLAVVPAEAEMAPQTVQPLKSELEIVQDEITCQQTQLQQLEEESRILGQQLAEVTALSAQLKIQASEGRADAHTSLDNVEREELVITRQREGLRLRIGTLQAAIGPKLRRASELAAMRDAERQDQAVREITQTCEALQLFKA